MRWTLGGRLLALRRWSILLLASSIVCPVLAAAQVRGVAAGDQTAPNGTRRAVIIGISKYPLLPPDKQLAYADSDARQFYQVLTSKAGGSIPASNVKLLLDADATSGAIAAALQWLRVESKKGDEAIIYFAGHGDVEKLTGEEGGYLLASDAFTSNYLAGGAIDVAIVEKFVQGIVKSQASVLVITDACRAGKLVGEAEGAQRTTAALLASWANVVKLVSSMPDQVSYEGKQWGGGHGAFTYFLNAGLQGLADTDGDGKVSLWELTKYVREHVEQETGGNQTPQTVGNTKVPLAWVDSSTLRAAQLAVASRRPTMQVASRSAEGVQPTDSALTVALEAFRAAVAAGALVDPPGASAWDAYRKLVAMRSARTLLPGITSTLALALQNSAQTVILDYLAGGNSQPSSERLRRGARELSLALQLLGKDYELASSLRARQRFLEGYAFVRENQPTQAVAPLRESITLEPRAAYAYNALGFAYLALDRFADARQAFGDASLRAPRWSYPMHGIGLVDAREGRGTEAERQFRQAIQQDPRYLEPRRELATLYISAQRSADAERVLLEALAMDSTNAKTLASLGALYQDLGKYRDAARFLERAIRFDSTTAESYIRLGIVYFYLDRVDDAVAAASRAGAIDGRNAWAFRVIGYVELSRDRYDQSVAAYRRAVEISPTSAELQNDLGFALLSAGRLADAEAALTRAEQLDPNAAQTQENLGTLFQRQGRAADAERHLRQAVALDSLTSSRYKSLGYFYYAQSRFTEAEAVYRRAVAVDSQSANLEEMLGWSLRKLERTKEAIPHFARAANLDSLNDQYANDLGVAQYDLEQYGDALKSFQRAAALASSDAVYAGNLGVTYKQLARWTDSEREYLRAARLDSTNASRFDDLGSLYWDRERWRDAEAAYRRATELDSTSADRARSLAMAYDKLGDTLQTERGYRRAVNLDSLNSFRWAELGVFYHRRKRYSDARSAFARAAELAPQSALAQRNLGITDQSLERYADAEREYRRAITLDSSYVEAYSSLGSFFFQQGNLAAAESSWRKGLSLRPRDGNALNNIAWLLYGRGALAEATPLSERSLADTTVTIQDRRNFLDTRANIALDAGNAQLALSLFEQALHDNPSPEGTLHLGRAMSLLALGREKEAVAAYQQALAADPKIVKREYLMNTVRYSPRVLTRVSRLQALAGLPPISDD